MWLPTLCWLPRTPWSATLALHHLKAHAGRSSNSTSPTILTCSDTHLLKSCTEEQKLESNFFLSLFYLEENFPLEIGEFHNPPVAFRADCAVVCTNVRICHRGHDQYSNWVCTTGFTVFWFTFLLFAVSICASLLSKRATITCAPIKQIRWTH